MTLFDSETRIIYQIKYHDPISPGLKGLISVDPSMAPEVMVVN